MFERFRKLSHKHSFFLFGPRGSGKSTLLKERFHPDHSICFDLLNQKVYEKFKENPSQVYEIVEGLPKQITHVIIDEIQKIPPLLDEVHRLIESSIQKIFILTGSSARKLKRGGANLLAGRAFVYHLFPLSCFELKSAFSLQNALQWGTLPKIFTFETEEEKNEFLRAYTATYLNEEIWGEQVVRNLHPFRKFLEVAAQSNGKIVNYANIARDVGVDEKTVKEYFIILEDTLIGFFLHPYHNSFRKRLVQKPKFYFFDTGVVRALSKRLSIPIAPKTTAFGNAFEHFIILEIQKLCSYFQPDYTLSFIMTASGVESDLILERPGLPLLCIEIKSRDDIQRKDISSFINLTKDIPDAEAIVLSQDIFTKKIDHVICYPWQELFKIITGK